MLPLNKMCRNINEKLQKPWPVRVRGLAALCRGVTMSCGMQIIVTELYLFKSAQLQQETWQESPSSVIFMVLACLQNSVILKKNITASQGPIYRAFLVCFAARSLWRALRFPTMFISHPRRAAHINESLCWCPVCCSPAKVSSIRQSSPETAGQINCG